MVLEAFKSNTDIQGHIIWSGWCLNMPRICDVTQQVAASLLQRLLMAEGSKKSYKYSVMNIVWNIGESYIFWPIFFLGFIVMIDLGGLLPLYLQLFFIPLLTNYMAAINNKCLRLCKMPAARISANCPFWKANVDKWLGA